MSSDQASAYTGPITEAGAEHSDSATGALALPAAIAVPAPDSERSTSTSNDSASGASGSATAQDDDEHWNCGVYFNKRDERLFVPKPHRWLGWTVNLGHAWGPAVLLGLVVVPVAIAVAADSKAWHKVAKSLRK
jgi:hypothetical protein